MNTIVDDISSSINNEIILLNIKWIIYKEFFYSTERKLLLCNVAPILFTLLQKLLLDDIAITLCRITDPHETKNKSETHQNNTLYQLFLKKDLDTKPVDEIKKMIKPLINIRNKIIAHRDLDLTIKKFLDNSVDQSTTFNIDFPLPLNELGSIIEEVNKVMNRATNRNFLYNDICSPCGPDVGVKALIDHLKEALFYDYLEKNDKFDPSDFYEDWLKFEHRNA